MKSITTEPEALSPGSEIVIADDSSIKSGLKKYSNLCRWYEMLSERPAVIKGYKFMDKASDIPKP